MCDELRVRVHEEIVPMGVDPERLRATDGGDHLTPAAFHQLVDEHIKGRGVCDVPQGTFAFICSAGLDSFPVFFPTICFFSPLLFYISLFLPPPPLFSNTN